MDLKEFASRFPDCRWLGDDRFQAHCSLPGHPDGDPEYSVLARVLDNQIKVACFSKLGHSSEKILRSLGLSPTDMAVPASGVPAAVFSANGTHIHLNGNGNAPQRDFGKWQLEVGYQFKQWFSAIPENQRELLAGNDENALVDTLVTQALDWTAEEKRPFWPLPELNETELDEEFRRLATKVVQAFREDYLPVPTTSNGHGLQLVTLPFELLNDAIVANEEYLKRIPVVEGLYYSSAVSMITGGKHAGKSTLARCLAISVAKGTPFLDRQVERGGVLYLASEDEAMAARQELIRLGWTENDDLKFVSMAGVNADHATVLATLTDYVQKTDVKLVLMDMLFDFAKIGDEMSYAQTREALGTIQRVAGAGNCHIVVIHHAPKHATFTQDAAVTALGSQGLAARVSPIVLVRKHGPDVHSVVSTSVRDPRGQAIVEKRLTLNEDGTLSLGAVWKDWMQAEVWKSKVHDLFEQEPDQEMTRPDIQEALGISQQLANACLRQLYKDGVLNRNGSGKKGSPFRYLLPSSNISDATDGPGLKLADPKGTHPQDHVPSEYDPESIQDWESQGRFGYKS